MSLYSYSREWKAPVAPGTAGELTGLLNAQRAAFGRGVPTYRQRMDALAALRDAVRARQEELVQAVDEDFGGRAREETLMLELFPFYDQVRHARRHLRRWMRRRRVGSSWFLHPAKAYYQFQPVGVIGVVGAWNYQLLLTLGPVIDAIAAGNHVMIKPSEITPRSADVIKSLVAEAFRSEYVTVVTGGPDVGAAFSALPFDHLFFTGSTRVGHLVMEAAARNLTPVTLELGGKSPAIVHETFPFALAVERIITGKLYNAGQTCVAPDYVMIPHGREEAFEREAARIVKKLFPRFAGNHDYTRIVNDRHMVRLNELVRDAEAQGARIVRLMAADEVPAADDRLIPPTLVFDPREDMAVMREEIFGPVLPVVTYRTFDEAIAWVNARPRPLALYYFDEDDERVNALLARTMSGGVTINDCIYHLGQHNLPFGGNGPSGMGHYHGQDGFETFSKKRGVMVQRRFSASRGFRAPWAPRRKMIDLLLRLALRSR